MGVDSWGDLPAEDPLLHASDPHQNQLQGPRLRAEERGSGGVPGREGEPAPQVVPSLSSVPEQRLYRPSLIVTKDRLRRQIEGKIYRMGVQGNFKHELFRSPAQLNRDHSDLHPSPRVHSRWICRSWSSGSHTRRPFPPPLTSHHA